MKRILLPIGIVLALIAAIVAVLALRQHGTEPASAPPAAASGPSLRITGTYADDWQSNCGPLTETAAQAACTTQLNTKYGRTEDTPVPKADR